MSDRDYASFTREIILGHESILKKIFIKIVIDIHTSMKNHIEVPKKDYADYLDDVIYFPDDLELTDATRLFTNNYLIVKKLRKFGSTIRPTSLKKLHTVLSTTRFNERNAKKTILNDIELPDNKPYRFTTLQMQEVGRIAEEINSIRNMVAHNNMVQKSPQAFIFFANLARLFQLTPDMVKAQISGFSELNEFVKENYFNSIVEVYKPEFLEIKNSNSEDDQIIEESILYEKISEINNQIEELNSIKLNISQNQKNIEDVISILNRLNEKIDNNQSLVKEDKSVSNIVQLKMPTSEVISSDDQEMNLNEDNINIEKNQSSLSNQEKSKLGQNDLELYYSSYDSALEDGIDKKKVALWAQNDLINGYDISTEDMFFVEQAVKDKAIDEDIYFDYVKEHIVDNVNSENLTLDELYDELMKLRVQIKNDMENNYDYFANWHNILLTSIAHEIIEEKVVSKNDFVNLDQYRKYYNSEQLPKRVRELPNVEEIKENARNLMNIQTEKYWPQIEVLVKRAF